MNNESDDDTYREAMKVWLIARNVLALRHTRNSGKDKVLITGCRASQGDAVITS